VLGGSSGDAMLLRGVALGEEDARSPFCLFFRGVDSSLPLSMGALFRSTYFGTRPYSCPSFSYGFKGVGDVGGTMVLVEEILKVLVSCKKGDDCHCHHRSQSDCSCEKGDEAVPKSWCRDSILARHARG
jgi:hypothetical protein